MNMDSEQAIIQDMCEEVPWALLENEQLVKRMALLCLKFRNYEKLSAIKRFVNYLSWRQTLFGNLRNQIMSEKLKSQIETCFMQVLPNRLPSGEAVIYLQLDRHDPLLYSTDDTIRCWHFLLMCALHDDVSLAAKGFVVMSNLSRVGISNLDMKLVEAIASSISKCMPIRLVNAFVWHPPFLLSFIIPVMKAILSSKLGQRLHVIYSLNSFVNDYNMPIEVVPGSLDGPAPEYDAISHVEKHSAFPYFA
jgi:hypothetical protein